MKIGRNHACPCGSGRKYKRCHIGNWPPTHSHSDINNHELHSPLTFTELADRLESSLAFMRAHPLTVVATVLKRLRETIHPTGMQTEDGVHVCIAGATILAACYRDQIHDYQADRVPVAEGIHADDFLSRIWHRLETRFGTSDTTPLLGMLQILSTQGALQGQHAFQLFRTLYLLELENFEESSRESPYDDLFRSAYGCSTAEYLAVLQGMWTVAAISGEFIAPEFVKHSPIAEQLHPVAARILSEHSCKIHAVKSVIDNEIGHHGLDGLVAAFFSKYPFVEFRPKLYFPAPHPYIRLFAMTSPVFRVLELGRKRAGIPESPESFRMGERFERLVTDLLTNGFNEDQIIREHPLDKKGSRRSADLILFEDDVATLVQAKIKRLSPLSFFGFDLNAIERDSKKAIAETISKSVKYLTWIDSDQAETALTDHARAVRARLRNSRKIFLLGTVPAMPSVFHVNAFRSMVSMGIDSLLRDNEKIWFAQNSHRIAGWHVIDSEELAEFMAWRDTWGLHEALSEYISLPGFGRFLIDGKVVAPFRGYVAARGRRLGLRPRLSKIDATVHRFLDWTLRFVFQKSYDDYATLESL